MSRVLVCDLRVGEKNKKMLRTQGLRFVGRSLLFGTLRRDLSLKINLRRPRSPAAAHITTFCYILLSITTFYVKFPYFGGGNGHVLVRLVLKSGP